MLETEVKESLPESSRQLHWLLARKLGGGAVIIGILTGGASYMLETGRAEQAALQHAADGARHFESTATQMAVSNGLSGKHGELDRMLDRSRFVSVHVFDPDRTLVYETWAAVPAALIAAARATRHDWPKPGQIHRKWIVVGEERLIQIIVPLIEKDGRIAGYLAGISRLDKQALRAQREQILNVALTAAMSVLATAILLYPLLLAMLRRATGLSRRLLDSNLSLLRSLGNAVAKRDSDTDAHNYRVTLYAVALAEAMGLPRRDIADLITGAFLHDVGKIGIPDRILLKPGKLTVEEFEVMKTHSLLGIEIVADNPWLESAALTIRHHHEHFDGTGYPDGLRGSAIPCNARIFAVVDVFDALTSERPYKEAMAIADALAIVERDSGRHFDPDVVTAFKAIAADLHAVTLRASEADLRRKMSEVLSRYFKA